MWICPDCENRNADTDSYCACCGSRRPAPQKKAAPSVHADAGSGSGFSRPSAPVASPEIRSGSASVPPALKRKQNGLPFVYYVAIAVAVFLLYKFISLSLSPKEPYTDSSAKNDLVYADVISIDPFSSYGAYNQNPLYIVCYCERPDQSKFIMYISPADYMAQFDETIKLGYREEKNYRTLSFHPAVRIYGEVNDAEFIFGKNASAYGFKTILNFKSKE